MLAALLSTRKSKDEGRSEDIPQFRKGKDKETHNDNIKDKG